MAVTFHDGERLDAKEVKQDDMITRLREWDFIASDTLEKSDDSEVYQLGALAWQKTITFNPIGIINRAEFRIKFDLKREGAGEKGYGRIYRNGVAVGTLRENTTTTYQTFSEDIGEWEVNDTIELWVGSTPGVTAPGGVARNFRVYATIVETTYTPSW